MAVTDFEIKNKIVSYLRKKDFGASASEIAKQISHNRITVGKYLSILEAEKLVSSKKIASAIYWSIAKNNCKPKILIVDDERHIVDLVKLSLSNNRYDLYEALDGQTGLEMVLQLSPDVLILDLMMPVLDGISVVKQLKESFLTKNMIIFILSAKNTVEDKRTVIGLGVDDYITKPFDPLELEARVANALRKKQSLEFKNNITGFSTELITAETLKNWSLKKDWTEVLIQLKNVEEYIELFGHKKGFEVLQLFSRLLASLIPKKSEYFIGHTSEFSFVVLIEKKGTLKKSIVSQFESLLPFLYVGVSGFSKDAELIKVLDSTTGQPVKHTPLAIEVKEVSHD